MTLPIAISLPHAGRRIPAEAADYCQLTGRQVIKDGDEFAAEIYDFRDNVAEFVTTDIARAIVDLNRAPDDRRPDGAVKTHTIWNEPIYREPLPPDVIAQLLDRYYYPYHERLSEFLECGVLFGVDCHTMAAEAPPISADAGTRRPEVCLGNVHGRTFPDTWTATLLRSFQEAFAGYEVTLNTPFAGGYICQTHGGAMPWLQLEVSRSQFLSTDDVRERITLALSATCRDIGLATGTSG